VKSYRAEIVETWVCRLDVEASDPDDAHEKAMEAFGEVDESAAEYDNAVVEKITDLATGEEPHCA
jgi:hypothetical protein